MYGNLKLFMKNTQTSWRLPLRVQICGYFMY